MFKMIVLFECSTLFFNSVGFETPSNQYSIEPVGGCQNEVFNTWMMALAKDISAEQLPGSQRGSVISLVHSETQANTTEPSQFQTDVTNLGQMSEVEMAEKVENIF